MWELLDAALNGQTGPLQVSSQGGHTFEWKNGSVWTCFETFDSWASHGKGSELDASRQALAAAYGDWTRETRQYLTTLNAHGLDVRFTLSDSGATLSDTFFIEPGTAAGCVEDSVITEHSYAELGTVAITLCTGDRVDNYYPVSPSGLNDIHAHIRKHAPGVHTVAFPGGILYDEDSRALLPDLSHSKTRH
jgi:hypothetical protein